MIVTFAVAPVGLVYGCVFDIPLKSSKVGKAIVVPLMLSGYVSDPGGGGFEEAFSMAYVLQSAALGFPLPVGAGVIDAAVVGVMVAGGMVAALVGGAVVAELMGDAVGKVLPGGAVVAAFVGAVDAGLLLVATGEGGVLVDVVGAALVTATTVAVEVAVALALTLGVG